MFLVSFPQKSRCRSLKTPSLRVYSINARPCGLAERGELGRSALNNPRKKQSLSRTEPIINSGESENSPLYNYHFNFSTSSVNCNVQVYPSSLG